MWKSIKILSANAVAIVAVLAALFFFSGGRVQVDNWSVVGSFKGAVFSIGDDAGDNTLRSLLKAAAIEFSAKDIEHIAQEGNRPDITIAAITLPGERKNVIKELRAACKGLGLSEFQIIDDGSSRICKGIYNGIVSISVDAKLECKDDCRLIIEIVSI